MNSRVSHLPDERLYDCYLAGRSGDVLDPSVAVHLTDCALCRARFTELGAFFDTVRDEGEAEADAIFTADRLQHQHDAVMRQIEHVNRSAKVISFPGGVSRHMGDGATSGVAPRWLAAAAAAGLFVGVVVGGAFSIPALRTARPPVARVQPTAAQPPRASQPAVLVTAPAAPTTVDDDTFLTELEFALQRPHTRELQPFDVLTPHAREIRSRVR